MKFLPDILKVPFGEFPVAAYDWAKAKFAKPEAQVIDEPVVPCEEERPPETKASDLEVHLSSLHATVLEQKVQQAVDTSRDEAIARALELREETAPQSQETNKAPEKKSHHHHRHHHKSHHHKSGSKK